MEEKILQAILEEIKGLRSDTNARFISLENRIGNVEDGITISNQRLGSLEAKSDESNHRLDSLENKVDESNKRLGSLENKFEGLKSSVEVLQIGVNQVRYELIGIKDILGTKVIWQNETITLEVKDGTKIYGTIHKGEK
jgi:chromosome segregation ATPase